MTYVITQSCCSDGSCVFACPVNCIHPSPDEPGFATAEMLHIDPVACVDCGACVSACPVGAIAPDSKLTAEQLPFVEINAGFYPKREGKLPPTSKLAPVPEAPQVHARGRGPLRVAIVGHTSSNFTAPRPGYDAFDLSADRANTVRQILEQEGLPSTHIFSVSGKADSEPLFPDDPSLAANRRVTITLMREDPPLPPNLKP